jgi:hypothetical protein
LYIQISIHKNRNILYWVFSSRKKIVVKIYNCAKYLLLKWCQKQNHQKCSFIYFHKWVSRLFGDIFLRTRKNKNNNNTDDVRNQQMYILLIFFRTEWEWKVHLVNIKKLYREEIKWKSHRERKKIISRLFCKNKQKTEYTVYWTMMNYLTSKQQQWRRLCPAGFIALLATNQLIFLNYRYTCLYRSTNDCNEYDTYHSYSSSIYNPTYYTDKLACIKAELACTSVMVGTINVIFITVAYISNQPQIPPPSTGQHFVECYNCHTRIQIV